jgi:hypothetical protein
MRYLNFKQKAKLATNIRTLLQEFGGYWITPDISLRTLLQKEDTAVDGHTKKLAEATGKDIESNLFDNVEHAQAFFEGLGFAVEIHRLDEIANELASPAALGMSDEYVADILAPAVTFVMRLSTKLNANGILP